MDSLIPIRPYKEGDNNIRTYAQLDFGVKKNWNEWWYVSFSDPEKNIFGRILFKIYTTKTQEQEALVRVFISGSIKTSYVESFPLSSCRIPTDICDIKMPPASFLQIDPSTFLLKTTLDKKNFSLELTYKKVTQGAVINFKHGMWAVPLPFAEVTGHIMHDNKKVALSGTGYQEHIWGDFIEDTIGWSWAEIPIKENSISLIFGSYTYKNTTQTCLVVTDKNGVLCTFSDNEIRTTYTFDTALKEKIYPKIIQIKGETENCKIQITTIIKTLFHGGMKGYNSAFLADYTGVITLRDRTIKIHSEGFFEYKTRKTSSIYTLFKNFFLKYTGL